MILFEWDPRKAEANRLKHRVSFDLAEAAFADPEAILARDRTVEGEQRWHLIGNVGDIGGILLLLVVHTFREVEDGDEIIRIISARRADANERKAYQAAL